MYCKRSETCSFAGLNPAILSFPSRIEQGKKPQTSHKFFNCGFTIIRVIFHAWNIAWLSDFFPFRNKWTSTAAASNARLFIIYGRLLTQDEIHNELITFLRLENAFSLKVINSLKCTYFMLKNSRIDKIDGNESDEISAFFECNGILIFPLIREKNKS